MKSEIVNILMQRDNLSKEDAEEMLETAKDRVLDGEDPESVLHEEFGLEPDYVFEILP